MNTEKSQEKYNKNTKPPITWDKINKFDFNQPLTDYGFVTRLADENKWTKNFTKKAILEYKKFMYLAATAGTMVSPSEIVDIVWHQHLIFTKSYNEFCDLLGKKIQHIPSTHNKAEFETFKNAKDNTTKFYEKEFGKQPKDIWEYNSMYAPLNLKESTTTIEKIVTMSSVISLIILIPLHFLLQPFYSHINGSFFFIFYIPLILVVGSILEISNNSYLQSMFRGWSKDSFIYDLDVSEVIYLKKGHKNDIIHNTINKLIQNKRIKINSKNGIEISKKLSIKSVEDFVIIDSIKTLSAASDDVFYPALLKSLTDKEIFKNTYQTMDKFTDTIKSSKRFVRLFLINYIVILSVMIIGLIRLLMGVSNDRPFLFIAILLLALVISCILYLKRLTKIIAKDIVPNFYKSIILPQKYGTKINKSTSHEWSYVYADSTVFDASFIPLVAYASSSSSSSNSDGGSCGSSCGSSDGGGSSCGSSCSSCGGGCGGCGG